MTVYEKLSEQIENVRFAAEGSSTPAVKAMWMRNLSKLIEKRNNLTVQEAGQDYSKWCELSEKLNVQPSILRESMSCLNSEKN
jgi:hypothetical protein